MKKGKNKDGNRFFGNVEEGNVHQGSTSISETTIPEVIVERKKQTRMIFFSFFLTRWNTFLDYLSFNSLHYNIIQL